MGKKRQTQQFCHDMNQIWQEYIAYLTKTQQSGPTQIEAITRVIKAFGCHLQKIGVELTGINIEHVDNFLKMFNASYSKTAQRLYRSYLRCFLRYLYNERNLIRQNLAYFLGLRPIEISRITLDDISFTKRLLSLKNRKNNSPLQLPIPEDTLKALTVYIIGGRPKSQYRSLFLIFWPDPTPMSAKLIGYYLTKALRDAGLPGTAYWLRHTFAQNMLESGARIFDIKEMLGHDSIESSRQYLCIHTQP